MNIARGFPKLDNKFLLRTQNSILSAAAVLLVASVVNAGLGFVKSRLLTMYFGVSDNLAIFYTADRVPNLIYSILVVGALSTIFIPIFTDQIKKDKERAFETASTIMNVVIGFFAILAGVMFLFAPWVMNLLVFGKYGQAEIELGANLMRIMLFSQLILVIGSLLTSILQSFKFFLLPALAPVLYNIGMIIGTIAFSKNFGIYGPALGVLIGSCLHLIVQIPLVRKTGFRFKLALNLQDSGLKKMAVLVPPRVASVLLANLVGTINNSLAILISGPSVIFLKFATQLQSLPVSMFGASIAAASLPTLSMESDNENMTNFKKTFIVSLHQMMYLVIPLSVLFLVLRVPIVRIVYGVSQFPWEATVKTSYVLAFYCISIFSQSANYLITRAFYALKDTGTPVKVSLVTIVINLALSLTMILGLKLGVWSITLAFSITSIIDTLAMLYLLNKKIGGFDVLAILVPFTKISYSAVFMGITLYLPLKLLDQFVFDTTRTLNLVLLTGIATVCGTATYLFFTWLFKVEEIQLFYKLLRRLNLTKVEQAVLVQEEK